MHKLINYYPNISKMNNGLNVLFFAIYLLTTASCGGGTYQANTYFENRTGHRIKVEPYWNKVLITDGVKTLVINENQLVNGEFGRGTAMGATYGDIAGDSIVVTFDDTLKVSHVGKNKAASPKSYAYTHSRNLLNRENYAYTVSESSKKARDNEYRYIFTPEDYQDALRLNK